MGVKFTVSYHPAVMLEDVPKLSTSVQRRIKQAIEQKLTTFPEQFGKPLRRSLAGYRKLRVGDYRVVFRIEGRTVKIFLIQHRSVVYMHTNRFL